MENWIVKYLKGPYSDKWTDFIAKPSTGPKAKKEFVLKSTLF